METIGQSWHWEDLETILPVRNQSHYTNCSVNFKNSLKKLWDLKHFWKFLFTHNDFEAVVWYNKLNIYTCRFCLFVIRSWKAHLWWYLQMKELLNVLYKFWVGKAGPILWPGRSCEFTMLAIFWSSVTEHIYIQPIGHKKNWSYLIFLVYEPVKKQKSTVFG